MGLLTLTADGRMMAVLCDGRKEVSSGESRHYASYCGNFTFDGTTLVTKVDASGTARIAVGTDQVRTIRFERGLLVLLPPPALVGDCVEHREMFWERVGDAR